MRNVGQMTAALLKQQMQNGFSFGALLMEIKPPSAFRGEEHVHSATGPIRNQLFPYPLFQYNEKCEGNFNPILIVQRLRYRGSMSEFRVQNLGFGK